MINVIAISLAIVIVISILVFYIYEARIYKFFIFKKLSKIKQGSLTIIDSKGQLLFKVDKSNYVAATIVLHDTDMFFKEVAKHGDVGLGRCYTKRIWTVPSRQDLVNMQLILTANIDILVSKQKVYKGKATDKEYEGESIQHHYDLGNDFYQAFLKDSLMAYTCGFWFCPSDTLETAQKNKVNMIIRKLKAKPSDTILDIGCGWGKITSYVQKETKATVHGVTISQEQINFIKDNVRNVSSFFGHFVPDNGVVYDRIYSIGMLEHVRCMNFDKFFATVSNSLKLNGRFVVHTITTSRNDTRCETGATDTFIKEYIFPNGQIPKIEWVLDAAKRNGFSLVHLETMGGHHYAKTLQTWRGNLLDAVPVLSKTYSQETINAYDYYMAQCEAAFFNDHMQLSHFVFDKIDHLMSVTSDIYSC